VESSATEALSRAIADRYRLEKELGRGGMATVYLARDLKHDRSVALKVLHPELAATLGPERFLREIRLVARLQHPHILTVLDSGEAAGHLWFTMPYVEGESLRPSIGDTGSWSGRSWKRTSDCSGSRSPRLLQVDGASAPPERVYRAIVPAGHEALQPEEAWVRHR
jgi:serine/threonine protein kinase